MGVADWREERALTNSLEATTEDNEEDRGLNIHFHLTIRFSRSGPFPSLTSMPSNKTRHRYAPCFPRRHLNPFVHPIYHV
jgi:hypothetical protein